MAKVVSDKRKPAKTKKASASRTTSSPVKGAPWDVNVEDDGDFVSPRIDLDEEEIKEREDRRGGKHGR